MRIQPCNNYNYPKKEQTFGAVSFDKLNNWYLKLSMKDPGIVSCKGVDSFSSINAHYLCNRFKEIGEEIFNPKNFDETKQRLLGIVAEVKKKSPSFSEDDAKAIEKMITSPDSGHNMMIEDAYFGKVENEYGGRYVTF